MFVSKEYLQLFFASVDASTLAQYRFHVYLFVNPKSELEFKMVVTVGLHDYVYIWNPHFICLLFKNLAD